MENQLSHTILSGTDGDDFIVNYGAYVSIGGGKGDDSLVSYNGSYSTLSGGDGDDFLANEDDGDHVLIDGGDGIDSIHNTGNYSTVLGGEDNDSIHNQGTDVLIDAGDGDNEISNTNRGERATIQSGAGSDTVFNGGNLTTIQSGAGDDCILSGAASVSIDAGDDNDIVSLGALAYNVTVRGGAGEDSVVNNGLNVLIDLGDDDDFAQNNAAASYVTVRAGAGDDYLGNFGSYSTILGEAGSDLIFNFGSNGFIDGGNDDDYLIAYEDGSNVTLAGGKGNDTIENESASSSISGGTGADSIRNYGPGSNATLDGGDGADSLYNSAMEAIINGGSGADYIVNYAGGTHALINGSGGAELIYNYADNVTINGGADADVISNKASSVVVDAGTGDDVVYSESLASDVTINGGSGSDLIQNLSSNAYIDGGNDDDEIYVMSMASNVTVRGGAGIDTIFVLGSNVYVDGGGDGDAFQMGDSASNTTLLGGAGEDTIYNRAAKSSISGGTGIDFIYNYASNVTINGDAGTDVIRNTASSVLADGGTGDDVLHNQGTAASNVTLNGGAGIDSINNEAAFVSILGGDGYDLIVSNNDGVTINGGTGNDKITVYGSRNVIQYDNGDGSDTVFGYNSTDTVSLTEYTMYNTLISGADFVVSLQNDSIVLKDAATLAVNINGGYFDNWNEKPNITLRGSTGNDDIINRAINVTIEGLGGDDTISNFGDNVKIYAGDGNDTVLNVGNTVAIDAGKGNDSVRNTGNYTTVIGGAGDDWLDGTGNHKIYQYAAGDGNDTIVSYDPSDTVRITDGSRYTTLVANNDVLVSLESGSILLKNSSTKTLNIKGGVRLLNAGDDAETFSFSADDGNNLIKNFAARDSIAVVGGSITSHRASGNDYIINVGSAWITLEGAAGFGFSTVDNMLIADRLVSIPSTYSLQSNDKPNKNFVGTAANDYMLNSAEGVTVRGNGGDDIIELSDYGELIIFGAADGHDSVTNFGANDTVQISNGSITSLATVGNDLVVNVKGSISGGSLTLKDAADYDFTVQGSVLSVVPDVATISNNENTTLVSGTDGDDLIINSGQHVTIQPGAGRDTVDGSTFGEVFWFGAADGQNLITNFDPRDTLQVVEGNIEAKTKVGDDWVITVRDSNHIGNITLKGAGDYGLRQDGNTIRLDTINVIINRSAGVKVEGSDDADMIVNAGYQGVSIQSGKGADTIEGSSFGEVFMFSSADGNNLVMNFGTNDSLYCSSGSITSCVKRGDDYVVTIGDAKITLAGTGDYTFKQSGRYLTIDHIEPIENSRDGATVKGTSNDDLIINSGDRVTISSGAGDDTITGSDTFGEMYLFASNTGDNVVTNFGLNDTLKCTAGSIASFKVDGDDVLVSLKGAAYSGTVRLLNTATYKFRQSGSYLLVDGVNTISNAEPNAPIAGTDNRDYIINSGSNATIDGKGGNDTIEGSNFGDVFLFGATSGRDLITNFGVTDTLKITQGAIQSRTAVGNDYVIEVRNSTYSGAITLAGASGYEFVEKDGMLTVEPDDNYVINNENGVKVTGTGGADWIINSGSRVTIQGNAGDDTIEGSTYGEMILVASNHGNDIVTNFGVNDTLRCTAGSINNWATVGDDVLVTLKGAAYSSVVTLLDAAGLDIVKSGSYLTVKPVIPDDTLISGTSGADVIDVSNGGKRITIQGNAGDDTITGSENGDLILVASNHGNDVIKNFGANDTLKCTAGKVNAIATVGNDVIVTLKGSAYSGTVTLKDAAGLNVVQSGSYVTVDPTPLIPSNTLISGTSGADVIDVSNGGKGITIQGNAGNDTITSSDNGDMILVASNHGNDVIKNFGENDTLKCTAGKVNAIATVGNDVIVTLKGSAYSGTVTLKDAAGLNVVQSGSYVTVDPTPLIPSNTLISGTSGADVIDVSNGGKGITIQGNAGNDTITGSDNGDLILVASNHGNDVIKNFGANDTLKCTAGKINTIATVGSDVIVTLKGSAYQGTVTLKDAAKLNVVQSGSYVTVDSTPVPSNTLISGTSGADVIDVSNGGKGITIQGNAGNDTITGSDNGDMILVASNHGNDVIKNFGSNDTLKCTAGKVNAIATVGSDVVVTLKGSAYQGTVTLKDAAKLNVVQSGNYITVKPTIEYDVIVNSADDVKVVGTSNADLIVNSGARVTIQGNAGDDTIEGSSYGEMILVASNHGNDVIVNFDANDTLRCTAGSIASVEKVGDNAVVSLKGAAYSATITLLDGGDYSFVKSGAYLTVADDNAAQLPTEDYWFMQSEDTIDELGSMLVENTSADEAAIGSLAVNFNPTTLLAPASSAAIKPARHLKK